MNQDATDWKDCLELAVKSDVGLRRHINQDAPAVALADSEKTWRQRGHVFVVADGMGAHAAGELASKLAAENVPSVYARLRNRAPTDALREAMLEANRIIHAQGQANEDYRGMGTTISTLALLPEGALVAHVGDTRVYRLRNRVLEQLTFDHSLVWEVCAAEGISEAEAPSYIPRNVLTRSAGPNPEIQVDLEGIYPVELGDAFLLTSDGLSGLVHDREMGIILGCLPADEALRTMVDLAILRGGPDNITAIAVRVTGPRLIGSSDSQTGAATSGSGSWMSPTSWAILAVFVLAALGSVGLALAGYTLAATAGLVATLILGLGTLLLCHPGDVGRQAPRDPSRLGRGPYTTLDCTPDEPFVEHLSQLLGELRATAVARNWIVDDEQMADFVDRARQAAGADDYAEAVRQYCYALSSATEQLRNQPSPKTPADDDAWVPDAE